MKIIYKLSVLLILACGIFSCSKFVEGYDASPNSPTSVTPGLLLSSTELGLQTTYTIGITRIACVLDQQIAGTKEQMLDVATYALREGDNTNEWNTVYNNIVQPSNDLIAQFESVDPYYAGIAKTLKAMGLAFATDTWGDVPATEAGMAILTGNQTPKFEAQQAVYTYILQLLADASTDLAKPASANVVVPSTDDYFYGGDIAKWQNVVIWLQARYNNHLSKKDPAGSATKVLALLGSSASSVLDKGDLNAVYGSKGNELNQWYAFENGRQDYIKAGGFFVNLLNTKNDPRLPFYFEKNASGGYSGSPVSTPDLTASIVGPYIASETSPIPIVTYAEALFIQAEAALRSSNTALAASAFNAAVKASVKTVTGANAPAAYITAEASETAATITLKKIMEQKYLALFANFEAWVDLRRTGFPVLTPNANASLTGIPKRLPTVIDERKYNPNAIVVSDLLKPIWLAE